MAAVGQAAPTVRISVTEREVATVAEMLATCVPTAQGAIININKIRPPYIQYHTRHA